MLIKFCFLVVLLFGDDVTRTNAQPTDKPRVYSISHCPLKTEGLKVGITKLDNMDDVKWLVKDQDYYYVEKTLEIILLRDFQIDHKKDLLMVMGQKISGAGKRNTPLKKGRCAIKGKVVNNQGKPVKGASIRFNCNEHDYNKTIVTDKNGDYLLSDLKPGFYSVSLEKGKSWNGRHKMQEVASNETATIDFIPLKDAAALCGEVQDKKGKPIHRCYVSINNLRSHKKDGVEYVQDHAWTDATGFFTFDNLPPTEYEVSISKEGVVDRSPGGTFRVEKGVEKEVTIKVLPGVIQGKVVFKGKKPKSSRLIHMVIRKQGKKGYGLWSTDARDDGTFMVNNVPEGVYEVKACLKGFYCDLEVVKVKKRGKAKNVKVTLLTAGAVLFKVTDRNGNPLDGVSISKIIPGGASSVLMEKVEAGLFRVYSVKPGTHTFTVNSSGRGRDSKTVKVKAGKEVKVEVEI